MKRDVEDARTSSFLHLLGLLEEVPESPDMLLLENVAGFETSLARERLISMLRKRNYVWQVSVSVQDYGGYIKVLGMR